MKVKLFHKTQRDLATCINHVIDQYWDDEIKEKHMIELIEKLYSANVSKFKKNNTYTTILRQQCGKRRLEVVEQIINKLHVS